MLKLTNQEIMDLIPKDLKSFGPDKGWKVRTNILFKCSAPTFTQQINGRLVVVRLTSKPYYINIQSIRRKASVFRHLYTKTWHVDRFAPGTTFLSIWSLPYKTKLKAIRSCLLYCVIGTKAFKA